jgi:Tat protein translocase TatB subunit
MFDIGFSEIIVCTVVGLIVIGPERLPEAVRTVGLWIGRIKRSLRETREEIERQVGMDDVRRQLHTEEMMRTLADMQEEIDSALNYERMGKNKPIVETLAVPIDPKSMTIKTVATDTVAADTEAANEHLINAGSIRGSEKISINTPN